MSALPKITVVTPSFNQGKFIEETIKSVISQEGDFTLEYIIMDGGSTDETVEVIKKYERLLEKGEYPVKCRGVRLIWKSEKDRGQADAVNKGFKASSGEILGWLNSDDTYNPGAIKSALKYFNGHKDGVMVYGEGYHIKESGEVIDRYYTEPFDFQRLAVLCFILQPTVFLRRRVLDEVGFLNEDLHFCMDYEYWIRIAKRFKVGYMPEYVANFRVYPETKTMSRRLDIHREIIKVIHANFGYVTRGPILVFADEYLKRFFGRDTRLKNNLFLKLYVRLVKYMFIRYNWRSISKRDIIKLLFFQVGLSDGPYNESLNL